MRPRDYRVEQLQRECEALMGDGFKDDDQARGAFDVKVLEIEIRNAVGIAGLEPEFATRMLADGVVPSIDKARAMIFTELATRSDAIETDHHIEVGAERGGHMGKIGLMAEALSARFGGPAPSAHAREFIHMRVVDMARVCVEQRGVSTRALSTGQVIQRALHTTTDFPSLLTETGNRMLRKGYESYQGGVRRICRESTIVDFRAKSKLALSNAPALLKVNEHDEFTRGTMAESKMSYSLETFGRIFGITRQALINDDLGAFADMQARYGRAAAEFIAAQLATKLTSNPTLADGVVLFHATHANLGTPAVISVASLGEGLKMMRLQTDLDGKTVIDVTPKYLVVPAALEVVARQNVTVINAAKSSDVNPFTADLDVVVEPRMDAVSGVSWYLAADSGAVDTIEYSFLQGEPGPQIETRAGFEVDGVEMKVRLDFGCGVIDHRGLFKNPGA